MSSCEYCKLKDNKEVYGKNMQLKKTAGYRKKDLKNKIFIMKNKADKQAGLMIENYEFGFTYININYCPMCGRKID